jgi:hypothetical protein
VNSSSFCNSLHSHQLFRYRMRGNSRTLCHPSRSKRNRSAYGYLRLITNAESKASVKDDGSIVKSRCPKNAKGSSSLLHNSSHTFDAHMHTNTTIHDIQHTRKYHFLGFVFPHFPHFPHFPPSCCFTCNFIVLHYSHGIWVTFVVVS